MTASHGIHGPLADLYDVFVDWDGRLARELPGIRAHLDSVGARRVLDVGCGTGRHVAALVQAGVDAHGADASEDMLARARDATRDARRFHSWRLGEAPPRSLANGTFDAILAMGNVWPQIVDEDAARHAARAFHELVRPGGLVLLGMKALTVRQERGEPYMPLLRRVRDGRALWFVRFVDFALEPAPVGPPVADFHMVVVSGEAGADPRPEPLVHDASRVRVWSPGELGAWFTDAGFADVRVSGSLADPEAAPSGEDVFVSCRIPTNL